MKLALVFPGQGSQAVGMMQGFTDTPVVRETFEEASSTLGQDFWKLVAEGPAEDLNATVNTQPVMLTAACAIYRAWQQAGAPAPALVAGHSLGEYTALVAAGVITFADAKKLELDNNSISPDGVSVQRGSYYNAGIFEIFGGYNRNYNDVYLKDGKNNLMKINMQLGPNNYSNDFIFVGWIM